MLHISLLKESDSKDLLEFEVENRRYFAASVSDRGDDYFSNFQTIMADDIEKQQRVCIPVKSATHSGNCRPPIPSGTGHSFR